MKQNSWEITNPDLYFQGKVVIEDKEQALKEANKYQAGLVMWTDGSKLDQDNTEAAVCWKDKRLSQQKNKSGFFWKSKESLGAEL